SSARLWKHGCGDWPLNNEWARQRPNCPPRHSLYQGVGKAARALAVGCQPLLGPDYAPISSHTKCLTNRWSQPLAVVMSTFDFMKQFSMFATLAAASGGSASSRSAASPRFMLKVNTTRMAEFTWSSPKGEIIGAGKEI